MVADVDPRLVETIITSAAKLATSGRIRGMGIERVDLHEDHLVIQIDQQVLLRICGLDIAANDQPDIKLSAPIARVRRGHELRLIIPSDTTSPAKPRNQKLVQLLADAIEARGLVLASPDRLLQQIAADHGRCRKRFTKLLHISWLAPEIVQSIIDGTQPSSLTASKLRDADLPLAWNEQAAALA